MSTLKKSIVVSLALGILMVSSAALTKIATPEKKMADARPRFSLETMIPASFGDWRIDRTMVPLQVDPETQERLDKIYNQTLSRTYVNSLGQRVMLSLAYGGDQSDNMSLHRPETCYTAQGFEVSNASTGELTTAYGALPVRRLFAVSGGRTEPITYWITVGNAITRPGIDQRLAQLRYGLTGLVPDGMLVRVSSIDADQPQAYLLQAQFVRTMLDAMDQSARTKLIGVFGA